MKRALLFSGGLYPRADRPRYRNNLSAFYSLLVAKYHYDKNDIRVCISDGGASDLDRDGHKESYSPATKKQFFADLEWLAQSQDTSVFIASNHGTPQGLCLWRDDSVITPQDVERAFSSSTARKIFILGQCYSGIFAQMKLSNAVICCACGDAETSTAIPHAKGTVPEYDEFFFHLLGALSGRSPDGASIDAVSHDLTLYEACGYARKKDRTMRTPLFFPDNPSDQWAREVRL